MHIHLAAVIAVAFMTTAQAPAPNAAAAPRGNGNEANGKNYQPRPAEVAPREKASGIQPPAAHEEKANEDLERIDKDALRSEGLGTNGVPKMTKSQ